MNQGIDLSNNNNVTDWGSLRQFCDVIIHKATQGIGYEDNLLKVRYPSIIGNNFRIGYYHFLDKTGSPEQQAQHFLDTINGLKNDTVLWLDIEDENAWDKQTAILWANAFINYLVARGYRTGIYTGLAFYDDYLKGNVKNNSVWWFASYPNQPIYYPNSASWQYTEKGTPRGTTGYIDLDYFLNDIFVNTTPKPVQPPQPVLAPLPSNFSEKYYLYKNPDVAQAVVKGQFKSGAQHYQLAGYKDNPPRQYTPPIPTGFNSSFYLQCNDDLVKAGYTVDNAIQHYISIGWSENRKCVPQEVITYMAYVQGIGFMKPVQFSQIAGTVGKGLRMEALNIVYHGSGILTFQGYVENDAWQPLVNNGMAIGTMGQAKRLEALKITLVNSPMKLSYQVQVANIGWMDWVQNGQVAGTMGKSLRIEAIRIKLE